MCQTSKYEIDVLVSKMWNLTLKVTAMQFINQLTFSADCQLDILVLLETTVCHFIKYKIQYKTVK